MSARSGRWLRFAATALASMVVLAGIWALDAASEYKGRPQLSAYDDDWDDLSDLRRAFEEDETPTVCLASTPITLDRLEDPAETILFVLGVEREFSRGEIETIVSFVADDGGTLVLADDFGFGSGLAEEFGMGFSRVPIRYFGPDVGGPIVPVEMRLAPGLPRSYDVLLNDASFLESERWGGIEVLARSPSSCWVDYDRDNEKDPEEPMMSVPVAARVQAGLGTVFLISDPSVFINSMLGQAENLELALALSHTKSGLPNRAVVFDESRHTPNGAGEVVQRAVYEVTERALTVDWGVVYAGVLLLVLVIGGLVVVRRPREMRHRDMLEDPEIVRLDPSMGRHSTYYKLRAIILERTRVRYHMAPWDYYSAYISSLPEDLSEWGLRSYLRDEPLDTSGLAMLEREVRTEYGSWDRARELPREADLEEVDVTTPEGLYGGDGVDGGENGSDDHLDFSDYGDHRDVVVRLDTWRGAR